MKGQLFGASLGMLLMAGLVWMVGLVSPKTGPYWTFFAASAVVFAILYAGTSEED